MAYERDEPLGKSCGYQIRLDWLVFIKNSTNYCPKINKTNHWILYEGSGLQKKKINIKKYLFHILKKEYRK